MSGLLTVLPLTFVMIAGPQIISAVFFLAASEHWSRNSLAYVVGAPISITLPSGRPRRAAATARSSPYGPSTTAARAPG